MDKNHWTTLLGCDHKSGVLSESVNIFKRVKRYAHMVECMVLINEFKVIH